MNRFHIVVLPGDGIGPEVTSAAWTVLETVAGRFGHRVTHEEAKVFADWGVIILDPSDAELSRVAEPIYRATIQKAPELAAALLERGNEHEGNSKQAFHGMSRRNGSRGASKQIVTA